MLLFHNEPSCSGFVIVYSFIIFALNILEVVYV